MADQRINSNNSIQEQKTHPAWYIAGGLIGLGAVSDGISQANFVYTNRKATNDYRKRLENESKKMMHQDMLKDPDYRDKMELLDLTKNEKIAGNFRSNLKKQNMINNKWKSLTPKEQSVYLSEAERKLKEDGFFKPNVYNSIEYNKMVKNQNPARSILKRMLK
ncbi:MAG: hypothetical protein N2043_02365 [Ignavibacterium sp.]|nr:hypothetical protein [Ignavibacterium sp.]